MIEWRTICGVFGPRFTTFFISMSLIELSAILIGITLGLSPIHSASLSFG